MADPQPFDIDIARKAAEECLSQAMILYGRLIIAESDSAIENDKVLEREVVKSREILMRAFTVLTANGNGILAKPFADKPSLFRLGKLTGNCAHCLAWCVLFLLWAEANVRMAGNWAELERRLADYGTLVQSFKCFLDPNTSASEHAERTRVMIETGALAAIEGRSNFVDYDGRCVLGQVSAFDFAEILAWIKKESVSASEMLIKANVELPMSKPDAASGDEGSRRPKLSEAEQRIIGVVRNEGMRMTTKAILAAIERQQGAVSEGTTKVCLATLVRRGLLTNRQDVIPKGYGLPEWP